ncbi:hypothetical protein D9M68_552500 [compost metagenome]
MQYRAVLPHDPQRGEIACRAEEHVTALEHGLRQGSAIGAGFDEDGCIGEAGDQYPGRETPDPRQDHAWRLLLAKGMHCGPGRRSEARIRTGDAGARRRAGGAR